ncbi:MAG: penicillin-insensitive murein endopeptidase, partial [Proteobacteria bacterium]|nr:penicillin-insensitive murein endopeptidase [Pseudomonadota bacterium]
APPRKAAARATTRLERKPTAKLASITTKRGRKARRLAIMQVNLGPAPGQSVGAPWMGRLQEASQLPDGDRYVIRRPSRAFGTRTAVDITKHVVDSILGDFPDVHALAIGDMSAEHGGAITQHRSHQAGRDLDLGLFYTTKPANYPEDFVSATDTNLDMSATFALIDAFSDTTTEDGGVQVMFLDYKVQGMLYEWAKEHEVEIEHLDKLFQYPHGRGAPNGIVRHEPNHDNHIHVRFKCPAEDTHCEY